MDDWYFILRAGTVIAIVAGVAFCAGMLLGKILWHRGKGNGDGTGRNNPDLRGENAPARRSPSEELRQDA